MLRKVHKIPEWKIKEVEELAKLIKEYKVFGIAMLEGLPSATLQQIRKVLRGKALIRVAKNRLFERALIKAGYEEYIDKVKPYLTGSNAFIFTNMNPFELYMTLEKYKIPAPAKPGDIAPREIVVPAGNTGIPPGPILSTFGNLKIPTKIQDGMIWIAKDTVVAKPGDVISPELASILQRLGIEPMEISMKLKMAFDGKFIFKEDDLRLDINTYKDMIAEAHINALKLAVEVAFPTPEVLTLALRKAYTDALILSVEANYVTTENIELIIAKALSQANSLATVLASKAPELGISMPKVEVTAKVEEKPVEEEKEEEEEEEKKEITEEEIAEGLGALFG